MTGELESECRVIRYVSGTGRHDPNCLHITGNRAAESSLTASEATKPRHFRAVNDGRDLPDEELPCQRTAKGFSVQDFEFSLLFDDGTAREMLAYATPLALRHGATKMSGNDRNAIETVLRDAFRKINADQAQTIRGAYYKAVEGLTTLADALEIADLEVGETNDHALIEEHTLACEAIETMEKSLLGRLL